MAEPYFTNLGEPHETVRFPGVHVDQIDLGDWTVSRFVGQPGWRWSKDVKPLVGGEWCQARHVGIMISGRFAIVLQDGTTFECGPDDVFDVPPGHDAWTVGNEPAVSIEWTGVRAFAGYRAGSRDRILATMLFTDVVESTELVARLGDVAWRDLLSSYYEAARASLERFRGKEINTTGDGFLATFEGPALALAFADAVRHAAQREDLQIRVGVHVGEVEKVGDDIRGVAVHEAARIMSVAGDGEILVSEMTRVLALTSGLEFEDRGLHPLKGLAGEWHLFAYVGRESS